MTQYNEVILVKTLELEIQLVINTYESWYAIYLDNVKNENYDEAKKNLVKLNNISSMLEKLTMKGKVLVANINSNDLYHDKTTTLNINSLIERALIIIQEQSKLNDESNNINTIHGMLDNIEQKQNTSYIQFVIIIIVGIIVIGLTAKSIVYQDETNIDIAILVIVSGLAIYFLITNLIIY